MSNLAGTRLFPSSASRRRRTARRILAGVIAFVVILLLAVVGISFFVGWSLSHPEREAISDMPGSYGLDYTEVSFVSRDGETGLKGWLIPAAGAEKKGKTIVFAHGYSRNRLQSDVPGLAVAKGLSEAGYDLLMFDFRGSGESGGSFTSVGQYETYDLLGAIDWVRNTGTPGQPVGLIGFSMGAATALMAAAADPEVIGVVADSPFSNLKEYLEANLSYWSNLPNFPFTPLIMWLLPQALDIDPASVDPYSAVNDIYPRPILFIHNEEDKAIPYTESLKMQQRHPDRFELWNAGAGGHVGTYKAFPDEYIRRVVTFFDSAGS